MVLSIISSFFDLNKKDLITKATEILDNDFQISDSEFYYDLNVGRVIFELKNQRLDHYSIDYQNNFLADKSSA